MSTFTESCRPTVDQGGEGPGRDERSPRVEGGGGGQPCSTETQIPDSMFPSVLILQGILLCKFQIPSSANSRPSFRVSKAPLWVRGRTMLSRFLDSMCADSRILHRYFQIPDSKCADSRILFRKFQIPSFRVSEAPSWARAQGTPKFQIPSFRVSEAPSLHFGPRQRDTQIPDSEFPIFQAAPSWVQVRGPP
jgi:hypothetical protein